jgi:hypothetical protein
MVASQIADSQFADSQIADICKILLCKRANAPDIVNRQLSAASERALASIVVST